MKITGAAKAMLAALALALMAPAAHAMSGAALKGVSSDTAAGPDILLVQGDPPGDDNPNPSVFREWPPRDMGSNRQYRRSDDRRVERRVERRDDRRVERRGDRQERRWDRDRDRDRGHYRDHRRHRDYSRNRYYDRSGPSVYFEYNARPRYVEPRYVQPRSAYRLNQAHYRWCERRYRSYRAYDNTFQPYNGPRRECISPYV